jgi:hypothetical protein
VATVIWNLEDNDDPKSPLPPDEEDEPGLIRVRPRPNDYPFVLTASMKKARADLKRRISYIFTKE